MWMNKYDVRTGALVKTLFEERNEAWVEPEKPVYFPEGFKDRFIWLSERDGFMNLYLYDTAGTLIRQLTHNRWVTTGISGLDKSGRKLIFTGTGPDPREMHAFSLDLKKLKVQRLTQEAGVHAVRISPDGKYLIDTWSSLHTPRVVEVVDVRSGKGVKSILNAPDPLKEYRIGKTEFVTLKADDGTPLYGRLIKPSDFDPDKEYPVLIYVYGGPHAQLVRNSWLGGARLWMYYQAEKGYVIFTLDGRGSARRGFAFESIIHRRLGTVEIKDQMTGVAYLKSKPWADADRMAVHGWSFGGFMTGSLMLRQPGTFRVGVAGGPVTDWKFYEVMYGERYMDRPEENPEGFEQASLLNYAGNLEGDLLIIHGAMDSTVVMQHSYALLNEFIKNDKQVDFFVYPGHPHNVRGRDRLHLMQKVLTYIDARMKEEDE
jgi:dipeptidyl-peptidase-4